METKSKSEVEIEIETEIGTEIKFENSNSNSNSNSKKRNRNFGQSQPFTQFWTQFWTSKFVPHQDLVSSSRTTFQACSSQHCTHPPRGSFTPPTGGFPPSGETIILPQGESFPPRGSIILPQGGSFPPRGSIPLRGSIQGRKHSVSGSKCKENTIHKGESVPSELQRMQVQFAVTTHRLGK